MPSLKLHVTLWPSMPHFARFASDERLAGIRLNSAMISSPELEKELGVLTSLGTSVPLYFDVKGRQLRIEEVHFNPNFLDITLNHPISVQTPTPVIFKAGADGAILQEVREDGKRLIFSGGPFYEVRIGESIHIRHSSLRVHGPLFTDQEKAKIEMVRAFGFTRYYLSYVESARDVDEFAELVGSDAELMLKIESPQGLVYVAREFKKREVLTLVAARGDLYVEIDRPHEILQALKLIVGRDAQAVVGSRLLLSVVQSPVPSCADFCELAWLHDIGYRHMLLCDELCLKGELLDTAVNAYEAFRRSYAESRVLAL
jgi:hypothetical protein